MWTPSDLLTDLDLLALDRLCLTDFGVSALADKRAVATDWIAQRVEQAGYKLWQHTTRKTPDAVFGYDGAIYTDYTTAASDATDGDVPLSSILTAPTKALYVGSRDPFKGLYAGVTDNVNAVTAALGAEVWNGRWLTVTSLADGTIATASKSFSGGGLVTWQRPDAWTRRLVNNSLLHWARLTISSSLTAGTKASQLTAIVPSRLTLPASYYTLGLLYQESFGANRGQWQEKADRFMAAAKELADTTLPLIADEFDVDDSDAVDRTEVGSVTATTAGLSTWERG